MKKQSLKGKWALITGSSRGIGQQIALGLANEGCNIIVHARKLENTEKTIQLLNKYNVKVEKVAGELSSPEAIDKIKQSVFEKTGGIDILYNNAAVMCNPKKIYELTLEEWQDIFMINFYAVTFLCSAFAPEMKKRGYGRIINVSSGIADQPDFALYSVSKAAVDKYTRDLAAELKDTNVLVNYLDPGWIKTDLGGENADNDIDTVLPGVILPALLDEKGPTGSMFCAQDYKYLGYDL